MPVYIAGYFELIFLHMAELQFSCPSSLHMLFICCTNSDFTDVSGGGAMVLGKLSPRRGVLQSGLQ